MPGLMCLGLDELGGTLSGSLVKTLSFANDKVSDLRSNYLLLQLAQTLLFSLMKEKLVYCLVGTTLRH